MDSSPQNPSLARRLELDSTISWDGFREGLRKIAEQEAPHFIESNDESCLEKLALAVADTAVFNAASLAFDKQAWHMFIETDDDGNKVLSEEEVDIIFRIAKVAGIITSWEVVRPSGVHTVCTIPSALVQQRLESFLADLP